MIKTLIQYASGSKYQSNSSSLSQLTTISFIIYKIIIQTNCLRLDDSSKMGDNV